MRRVSLNIVGLLVYIAVIVGAGLVLRIVGVDHTVAWVLGIVAGGIVMAAFQISGFYSRLWREDSGTPIPGTRLGYEPELRSAFVGAPKGLRTRATRRERNHLRMHRPEDLRGV